MKSRFPPEIDAGQLQSILRTFCCNFALGGFNPIGGPSLDLCRALLALRDPALGGRLSLEHVPALISLLRFWKAAFRRCRPFNSGTITISRGTWWAKVSSYSLRGLLWAGGATASNKVIEALVSRFARGRQLSLEGYLMSMARLHLAHGITLLLIKLLPKFVNPFLEFFRTISQFRHKGQSKPPESGGDDSDDYLLLTSDVFSNYIHWPIPL